VLKDDPYYYPNFSWWRISMSSITTIPFNPIGNQQRSRKLVICSSKPPLDLVVQASLQPPVLTTTKLEMFYAARFMPYDCGACACGIYIIREMCARFLKCFALVQRSSGKNDFVAKKDLFSLYF